MKRHPVPIEEAAVRQIANNSAALDLYCWLAYRLHYLDAPRLVTWKALHAQFGRATAQMYHFKPHFRQTLELALSVYPGASVELDIRGITLKPSASPVQPKMVAVGGITQVPKRGLLI